MTDSALTSMLNRMHAQWQLAGAPIAGLLAPGLAPEAVVSALGSFGLAAPAELVEWFTWHNGIVAPADAGDYVGSCGIAHYRYQSLERCLAELKGWRDALWAESPELFPASWFTLLRGGGREVLVVEVDEQSDRCRTGEFDPTGVFSFTTESIADLVEPWVERIECGELTWMEQGGSGYWGPPRSAPLGW